MSDQYYRHIHRSFELAKIAAEKGNHPFGALLVFKSGLILESENTVVETNDPTQHAELRLVSLASRNFSATDLGQAILFSSTEPCAMCSGAIFWAGIRHIVFACSASRLEIIANSLLTTECKEVLKNAKEAVRIEGPFFEDEAVLIHQTYWAKT